jgi:very-short-patch-repair endonuclease
MNSERARSLRNLSTDAERRLWQALRNRQLEGAKFRRQHPIGPYFVDFACIEAALIIEADGSQHADQIDYDRQRSVFLSEKGFRILRFWDNEILANTEGVLEAIRTSLIATPSPQPSPPHAGERANTSPRAPPLPAGERAGVRGKEMP